MNLQTFTLSICLLLSTVSMQAQAADGEVSFDVIVLSGDGAPDGNGKFASFGLDIVDLNDAGQVAFFAQLSHTSGGIADDSGVFRSDGAGGLVQIAREGQDTPDGQGNSLSYIDRLPLINNAGQVVFTGRFEGPGGGSAILRGSSVDDLVQIAREGQPAPGGGDFLSVGRAYPSDFSLLVNDLGQVAFGARISENGGSESTK